MWSSRRRLTPLPAPQVAGLPPMAADYLPFFFFFSPGTELKNALWENHPDTWHCAKEDHSMRQHQGAYLALMHSCTAWGSRDECLFQLKHWCNLHNSHESARWSCSQSPHVNTVGGRKEGEKEPAPCTGCAQKEVVQKGWTKNEGCWGRKEGRKEQNMKSTYQKQRERHRNITEWPVQLWKGQAGKQSM